MPIQARFFKSNDYIGLRFFEGTIFGRVDQVDISSFEPWNGADESNTALSIAAQAASSGPDIIPRDPRQVGMPLLGGQSLTALVSGSSDRAQIMHGAFGIFPTNFQLYIRVPAKGGGDLGGLLPGLAPPAEASGDHLAKVSGDQSPYEIPTNYREIVIPPATDISIGYWNDEPAGLTGQAYDAEQPILNALFARYGLELLKPVLDPAKTKFANDFEKEKGKRDNRLIKSLVSGKLPNSPNMRFEYLNAGTGFIPMKYTQDVGRLWGVQPIPDRVALLLQEDF